MSQFTRAVLPKRLSSSVGYMFTRMQSTAATNAAAATATATATASTKTTDATPDSPVAAKVSIKDLFRIRPYKIKEDDKAFQELDRMCSQGEKTKLVSEFPLELPFESIQEKGVSIVLEDKKTGAFAGTTRSYIHDVMVNGVNRKISYHFLLRVNPTYRNQGLGGYIMGLLYKNDVVAGDVDYIYAYVIENNNTSAAIQKKVQSQNESRTGSSNEGAMLAGFENLGIFSSLAWHINPQTPLVSPLSAQAAAQISIRHVTNAQEQLAILRDPKALFSSQLFPADVEKLVSSPLNLGIYVAKDAATGREAGFLSWDSGRVRKTYIQGSTLHYDKSVLLYNSWASDASEESSQLLHHLLFTVGNQYAATGKYTSLLTYVPKGSSLTTALAKTSAYNVEWMLKFWQIKGEKRVTDVNGRKVFFDPRTCLL